MARKNRTQAAPETIGGGVHAGRDVTFGGKHIHYHVADLSHVEASFERILALLRESQTTLRVVFPERNRPVIRMTGAGNEVVEVGHEFASALGQLQRTSEPLKREELYLTRFTLDRLYARWERTYLPLEGMLHLEPGLRLTDTSDPGISPAGIQLQDIRKAMTELDKPRLVLLGEPGAGKTTTLERLALDLSRERLHDRVKGKLPIRIDLFKYTDQRNPSDFLAGEWQYTGLAESYGESLALGEICFLLDGVNQMPFDDRSRRIEKWAHWASSTSDLPQGNMVIFTCRTADYTSSLRLPEVRIQALDRERMRQYFELRFGPEEAPRQWNEFDRRLSSGEQRFERLARNPFMLSLLAENTAEGKRLTDNRARLMDDLAMRLIEHELQEGRQPPALTDDKLATLNDTMQALSHLAFDMQVSGEGTSVSEIEAHKLPVWENPSIRLSRKDVLSLALDAHVIEPTLVKREGKEQPGYTFYHHLLQEYFAARRLLEHYRAGKNLRTYARVPWRRWEFLPQRMRLGEPMDPPPVTGWEETIIMAASLAGKDATAFNSAVANLNLPLAGRCLAVANPQRSDLIVSSELLRKRLLARQRDGNAHLRARLDAGLALGELGHPELQPSVFDFDGHEVKAILPPMKIVPEGEFVFGSDPTDEQGYDDEKTIQRRQRLPEYSIGRYAVTNAEFRYFIDAGGYEDDRWWSEEGKKWKKGGPEAHAEAIQDLLKIREYYKTVDLDRYAQGYWLPSRRRYWKRLATLEGDELMEQMRKQFERPFDRPAFWDDLEISNPARPLVGVNWFEAQAYCAWLLGVTGHDFQLPSEMEWEKAARGQDGRAYAWGGKFKSTICNTMESHIYETTPVGLYPDGRSPYGLFDCCGNVWEWTQSLYRVYPGSDAENEDFGERFKVVRGGSWCDLHRDARCASRLRLVPDYFDFFLGFRVLSPGIFLDPGC